MIHTKHTHRCVVGFTVSNEGVAIDYGSGEEHVDWASWDKLMSRIAKSRGALENVPIEKPAAKPKRKRA
jgi:hypothetical protein